MSEADLVDIKFRLYDGSDIGPFRYSATSTVDMLKQRIVSDWPKGKTVVPKAVNEVKLISSGKILENDKTVGQCKVPFGEVAGGIIIMHVVVQPSLAKTKTGDGRFKLTSFNFLDVFRRIQTVKVQSIHLPPAFPSRRTSQILP
ncbi:hypothetical protein ES332_D12G229200v1 [Gossypium tomentosum]|uniref:Ubiquitin-like domain-containing protein n=1 Tax=Gossypium tomentosum TaxID=34277 RepID=A0A5D2ICB9_GOSTO|nr:hypothetical protein ES332_D12G229200v1 [Gossypium tomentosum]